MTPHAPYFIIKIPRKRKEKIGTFFIPEVERYMGHNYQHGEIVGIGEGAAKHFPEAKVGHTLLVHHLVENMNEEEAREDHLVDQDDDYNYYVVTAYEYAGKNIEAYGVWDGEKIIPNKDYIFLVPNNDPSELKQSDSGLFIFNNWKETREDLERKQAQIKDQSENLAKSNPQKEHIAKGIAEMEREMSNISVKINKREYLPFKIAAYNPELSEQAIETAYVYNIAAHTEISFMGKTYIVAMSKHIGGVC